MPSISVVELLLKCFSDSGSSLLCYKVRKEVLPCLRSFTSSLRVAEHIVGEAPLIREFPREVTTINTLGECYVKDCNVSAKLTCQC